MATDKRVSYEMQGHKKPARNYLGKQKTVKNIPVKWKSGPKAPATELAYITKAEKNLLIKKDLHGSLKHGPNTGPDGIMSLDSQGDYTRDRSPGAYTGGGGSPNQQSQSTGTSQQALRNRAMNEAHMKAILTGQKDIGQTSAVSDRVRRGAVPEWVTTPSGKRKYVGSAYKSTGQQGWLSKLLGGSGYRGTVGTGSGRFFDKKSSIGKYNAATGLYESDEEDVGDLKPGMPNFGLMGLIQALQKKFKKPRDMSQFNKLSLTAPENQKAYIPQGSDMPMARLDPWSTPINNDIVPLAKPINYSQIGVGDNYTKAESDAMNMGGNDGLYTGEKNWFSNVNEPPMGNKDGGRIGYNRGRVVNPGGYRGDEDFEEFEDENTLDFMRDQGVPYGEMAEGESAFEMRIQELVDEGMSWQEAYKIAAQEFGMQAEGEESFGEEGIASIV